MKEKILLDTNMMICLLDNPVLDAKISNLTKILYDSDKYTIVIHPQALEEARKIKDQNEKDILISKLKVYKITDNPLEITEEFNKLAGCKNEKDNTVEKNCVSYFISNDKEIWKKAEKLHLKDRVLTIDEALIKFKKAEKVVVQTPVFIKKE